MKCHFNQYFVNNNNNNNSPQAQYVRSYHSGDLGVVLDNTEYLV